MAARFTRLPGTSRRYLDTKTGETISRVERDKRASAEGSRSKFDVVRAAEQRRAQARYQSLVQSFQDKQASAGRKLSKREIRTSEPFKKAVADLNAGQERQRKAKTKLRDAKTPAQREKAEASMRAANDQMRRALEALGRREGIAKWVPVGFSERRKKGRIRSPANLPRMWRGKK